MPKSLPKISKFIRKLLQILEDPNCQSIIKWSPDFDGVQILNRKSLETHVLPEHFKLRKVTSFIRQLHLYGFHKSKNQKKTNTFEHPLFFKSPQCDYSIIKRKYREKSLTISNEMIENESSEFKDVQKPNVPTPLVSVRSIQDVVVHKGGFKTTSNETIFEQWYLNKEDLSFFLEDCLN